VNTVSKYRLHWLLAGMPIAMMIVGISLGLIFALRTGNYEVLLSHKGLLQLSTFLYAAVGGLILSRHPRNIIGWLFIATSFLAGLSALNDGYAAYQSLNASGEIPGLAWIDWIRRWAWMPISLLPTMFVFLHFPYGRYPGRRWALVAWCAYLGLLGTVLSLAFHPGSIWDLPSPNRFRIPGAGTLFETTLYLSMAILSIGFLGSLLALGLRFRRSKGIEREQMKWLVFAVAVYISGSILAAAAPAVFPISEALASELLLLVTSLGVATIVVAVGVAILRYRLYDIDLVINRTLVYGALTAIVFSVYLLVVGGLGLLFQASGNLGQSLVGVGIVAVVVQPVRDQLQRAVNRLMYGARDDPYAALSQLGQRLENTLAPDKVLSTIVETVAQSLKLPYAAILLDVPADSANPGNASSILASHGTPTEERLSVPLAYQGENVGALLVGPRRGEGFSTADRRLLDDLARQAGVTVHAVRLTTELQRSRERLVSTREEERRRLRRDLHDGLGSQLAALHLQIDTLRKLIPTEPTTAQEIALELRDEIHEAVSDIRRLVYELRPPALDELGLAGAIRALAAQCSSNDGLQVTVEAPEPLPPLSAAVEVAVYRIAQEALTNVVHHARARRCVIHIGLNQDLLLEIIDDGQGVPDQPHLGAGLRSMRERAEELGGRCMVRNTQPHGTQISVQLPLSQTVQ